MTKAIGQVSPNPDTLPGGGDVYDGRVFENFATAINATRGAVVSQADQIAALQAQSAADLTPRGINPVEATSDAGAGPNLAYDDHAHAGISQVTVPGPTTLTGALVLNGNVTAIGNSLTFGAGGLLRNFPFQTPNRVSSNYQALVTDYAIFTTGAITVTLPAANAGADGFTIFIRNDDTGNTAHFVRHGADTVDGVTTPIALNPPASSSPYVGVLCVSNGSNRWSANFVGG